MLSFAVTMAVDGGVLWDFVSNNRVIDEKALRETSIIGSLLLARLFNLPAMMGFWFAAPLIMWNGMGVGKAIFYSFFCRLACSCCVCDISSCVGRYIAVSTCCIGLVGNAAARYLGHIKSLFVTLGAGDICRLVHHVLHIV